MFTIRIFVWIVILILLSIAIYLGYLNRSSEKVITGIMTIIFIAVSTTLVSTLFLIKEEKKEARYVKMYIYNSINKQPAYTHRVYPSFILAGKHSAIDISTFVGYAIDENPSLAVIKNLKDEFDEGVNLYFNVFINQIFQTLIMNCNWKAGVEREEGFTWGRASYSETPEGVTSSKFTLDDLIKLFPEIYLLKKSHMLTDSKLSGPPGVKISRNENTIIITNKFLKLEISLKMSGHAYNAGYAKIFLDLDNFENLKHITLDCVVSVKANFSSIRSGHPEMKYYHDWVDKIINEFDIAFNTKKHLAEAKENYLFFKHIPSVTKEESIDLQNKYMEWRDSELDKQIKNN